MKRTIVIAAGAALVVTAAAFALGRASGNGGGEVSASSHETEPASYRPAVIPGAEHVHSLAFLPGGELLLGSHGGLFRSADGGRTWEKTEPSGELASTDFMSLVPDPEDPGVLYAGGHGLGVVRSRDGGATWERADQGIDGTDIHALAVNARKPDSLFAYSVDRGVYRSADGAESWQRLDSGPDNPGVRSFAYMAVQTDMDRSMGTDNWGLLFAGTADGLSDSFSCFCGWHHTTDDFDGTTVYTLAAPHAQLGTMYAGTDDGLWRSTDEGKIWARRDGPAGRITAVAVDPSNPESLIAVSEAGLVWASSDGGDTWEQHS